MTTRKPRRRRRAHSSSQSTVAVGTGRRAPAGIVAPAATSSAASATSGGAGTATSAKPSGASADPHLRPPAARPLDEPERKVVEQLVRDHDARRELDRGELGQRGRDRTDVLDRPGRLVRVVAHRGSEGAVGRLEREQLALRDPQRGGALDEHVPQRARALRLGPEHVRRQPPAPGAGVDDDERVRTGELGPRAVEISGDEGAEQHADLGARDEVAPRTPGAAAPGVEPAVLVVQGGVDEPVERDRPLAPDALSDPLGEIRSVLGMEGTLCERRLPRTGGRQPGNATSPIRANSWG